MTRLWTGAHLSVYGVWREGEKDVEERRRILAERRRQPWSYMQARSTRSEDAQERIACGARKRRSRGARKRDRTKVAGRDDRCDECEEERRGGV